MKNNIEVINANENNLKNVTVSVPKNLLCGICGVSGSGKSTLACEVIAKYALNNFALSMPYYLRKKLMMDKNPDVLEVKNVPPTILIDIKIANRSSRSTVATTSGLMSTLRNMFATCGGRDDAGTNTKRVKVYPRLFSYNILEENGGGACKYCNGLGREDSIIYSRIKGDENKKVFEGGFTVVNNKGIQYTKITNLFLEAFMGEYNIDLNKKVKDLSKEEIDLLLYGSDKIIKFTDRSGSNGGKKELKFPGIINALLDVYGRTKNENIGKLVASVPCHYCGGSRFNEEALAYKIDGKNIFNYLSMSIDEALEEMQKLANSNREELKGFAEEFIEEAKELKDIGVGYLELNRGIATISGGELQRVKLAKQIAMKFNGYCYVIDEPTTGLHNANIVELIKSLRRLKGNGNTVLVVEHNPLFLKNCDYLIELGEGGGKNGGNIIAMGTPEEIKKLPTLTGKILKENISYINEINSVNDKKITLKNINVNNLCDVSISIPMHSFVTVAGVSGSGKSSAINIALSDAISGYLDNADNPNLKIDEKITDIIKLDQNASVLTSRSTVATLLGIMDNIRKMFSELDDAKERGLDYKTFSKKSDVGSCTYCKGLGYIPNEDNFEEECFMCTGTGYSEEVLSVRYKNYNIFELLSLTIDELVSIIENEDILKIISSCKNIGLGYLSLNRKSPTLSKGEYQRIRIATEICKSSKDNSIFILDEPSKGLHISDAMCIVKAIRNLVNMGHTVIAIEHNLNVIMQSDYVLEFGPYAGKKGGKLVFAGTPKELSSANTLTSKSLKEEVLDIDLEKCDNLSDIIKVKSLEYDLEIKKNKINILRGCIGSGKTRLLKELLYANPLKKYIACVSSQGKYLTRDIDAIKNEGDSLPLARMVINDKNFFSKNERIIESLNISQIIKLLYYNYGDMIDKLNADCFDVSTHAFKCMACKGKGRIQHFDFDKLFQSEEHYGYLIDLLNDRSRISRIQPLLKRDYGIDIAKKYQDMSEEEKRIYLYGDRAKKVFYVPKKKEYIWEGVNKILANNLEYASPLLQEFIKPTYQVYECSYCAGTGANTKALEVTYKGISYEKLFKLKIEELLEILTKDKELCEEEGILISYLKIMINLGLKDFRLGDYTLELDTSKQLIIQYLTYRFNKLDNTLILFDDFGAIKNKNIKDSLIEDFKNAIKENVTLVIADNNLVIDGSKEIILNNNMITTNNNLNDENKVLFVKNYEGKIINREDIEISSRLSIGSATDVISQIRKVFKKNYKEYNFTGVKDQEKCMKCQGLGYYEVNLGDIGYSKVMCPECLGTGLSDAILNAKVYGLNIGDILNMPIKEITSWLDEVKLKEEKEKINLYIDMGLGKLSLSKTVNKMSYHEVSLMAIANYLKEEEDAIALKNFFINVWDEEMKSIISNLNELAKKYHKKIIILED